MRQLTVSKPGYNPKTLQRQLSSRSRVSHGGGNIPSQQLKDSDILEDFLFNTQTQQFIQTKLTDINNENVIKYLTILNKDPFDRQER